MAFATIGSRSLAGQAPSAKAAPAEKAWTGARTADGQPDLQGTWENFDTTPFERPEPRPQNAPRGGGGGVAIGPPGFWSEAGKNAPRPSMVVDPPTGRVPVMAWAEAKREYNTAHIGDSWENQTPWERCITRGAPGGLFPAAYNNAYQIVQGPGYVVILQEMIHEARVIPVDGSPHLPATIRLWAGDARGHWEGNTLVVDITNYNDKGSIATSGATGRIRGIPQSEDLHVVERFTRVSEKTISYEVTISDPKVYAAPWKVAMPLNRNDDYQIFEYACHEGNNAMPDTLSGGRAQDKADAAKTVK